MNDNTPAYARLGFKYNPFCTLDGSERQVSLLIRPELRAFIETRGMDWKVLELMGDSGAGKTSAMHCLEEYCQAQGLRTGYEHLSTPRQRIQSDVVSYDVFFLDEAQRARSRQLKKLLRLPLRFVMGTHASIEECCADRGTFYSLNFEPATMEFFRAMITRRLQLADASERDTFLLDDEFLRAWMDDSQGNLLRAELVGYELFQTIETWAEMTAPRLNEVAARFWPRVEIRILP